MSEATEPEFKAVLYEQPSERIVRIVLNRPEMANAQNLQMLYDLNAALDKAAGDDDVRLIIVAAAGKHFSSGHGPMGGPDDYSLQDVAISTSRGFGQPGIEGGVLEMATQNDTVVAVGWLGNEAAVWHSRLPR